MVNKKGASGHVEMILSFVIFISFILFIILIFRPVKLLKSDTSSLDITKNAIIEHLKVDLTTSSIILSSDFSANRGDCFYLDFNLEENVVMKDENKINAEKNSGQLYFEYSGERFYRIFSSSELEEADYSPEVCNPLNVDDYSLGVTKETEKISYSKLESFFQNYNSDYEEIKSSLGVVNDFNVIASDNSGIIFQGNKEKPLGVEVKAKEISIETLNKDADIKYIILNIQVW